MASRGEQRDVAFRELRLLLTRQPMESRQWRDYWIVWLPMFTAMVVADEILDPPLLSWVSAAILVGGLAFGHALGTALRALGVVGRDDDLRP